MPLRGHLPNGVGEEGSLRQVVEHDFTEAQCQVGDEVAGRHDFKDGQAVDVAHRVVEELQRGRSRPRPFTVTSSR